LLVEDDELNQVLVRTVLARSADPVLQAAELVAVGSLARARAVLADGWVDVVLLDMHLPDGSGLALAAELQQAAGVPQVPAAPQVPEPRSADGRRSPVVVALSGAAAEQRAAALAAGCAAVLGKPYTAAELCELLVTHLPDRREGQAPTG